MSRPVSVLLYVQHLLGLGHLKRAATIARHLDRRGMDVTVVTGGIPVPGIDFGEARVVQLPPLRTADAAFSALVDESGAAPSEIVLAARRARLLATFRITAPDVVLTEHFPFGRRQLRDEILALLDECRSRPRRPWIMASVRDVVVPPRDVDQCLGWIERYFDAVLVHGDPSIIPFEASFPEAARIADKIHYTGYVAEVADPVSTDRHEIIVSAGGGTEAASLIDAALTARALCKASDAPWRILAGPNADIDALSNRARDGVTIERFRRDMPDLLARCRLSISRAGYNTLLEALTAGARTVVVPFETERETEQALRAERFAEAGFCTLVRQADLTPARLAQAIDAALALPPPDHAGVALEGVAATAGLIADWVAAPSALTA
jgi:predicted glycosyltransferase